MSQGEASVASVASVGQWVSVGHRKGRRVVDEGSGGSEDPAGSSQDGGLGISRPFAIEVSKVVSKVAGIGKTKSMAIDKRVPVVAVVSVGLGLSCNGSKEAKSSNGLKSFGSTSFYLLKTKWVV